MERQKNFKTIEDYLAELNNEAFVAGVDKSIRITQETGFETGFHMFYDSEVGIFFDDIEIERTRPSKSDLKSTNINRRTSKYNPVSIIIGLETRDKRKEQFPAFVYQEKDEVLLDETFDFDGIQRGLEITKEELVILKIFKMNPNGILQLYHLANKSYHNFDGKYNLGRGVSLLKTFNLLDGMKSRIY